MGPIFSSRSSDSNAGFAASVSSGSTSNETSKKRLPSGSDHSSTVSSYGNDGGVSFHLRASTGPSTARSSSTVPFRNVSLMTASCASLNSLRSFSAPCATFSNLP